MNRNHREESTMRSIAALRIIRSFACFFEGIGLATRTPAWTLGSERLLAVFAKITK